MKRLLTKPRATNLLRSRAAPMRFLSDTRGTTAIEYGFIGLLIFVVIVASVTQIGSNLIPIFRNVAGGLTGAN